MKQHLKAPPTLAACRVLEYAVLDHTVGYSGHSSLFRDDKEVGPVACLAICQSLKGSGFRLFHCDRDWDILGTATCESPTEARISAERVYPGVSALWVDARVTELDAATHLEEIWGSHRCNFCGKTPLELENVMMVEKNGTRICASCLRAAYEVLQEEEQGK